jgi:glycosyltransferase involved in cell wall biosynthesis
VPSLCYENSPTVIYEALQAGIPVLASDIGGVGELVQNGRNGYLFKPGSQEDFIEKLEMMDRKKDIYFRAQDDIQRTVAPYALKMYTDTLVKKLEEVIRG